MKSSAHFASSIGYRHEHHQHLYLVTFACRSCLRLVTPTSISFLQPYMTKNMATGKHAIMTYPVSFSGMSERAPIVTRVVTLLQSLERKQKLSTFLQSCQFTERQNHVSIQRGETIATDAFGSGEPAWPGEDSPNGWSLHYPSQET